MTDQTSNLSQFHDELGKIYNCIDNTTLSGSDNKRRINELCEDSLRMYESFDKQNNVAAVCVYPVFVRQAKQLLQGTPIKVASVAGAFPAGQSPLPVKLAEVRYAVDEGADEIDMVISRGIFLEGNYNRVFDEIASIRQVCRQQCLKVILETGELTTCDNIRKASEISIAAGADFIKTSTGKIEIGATLEAAEVMLSVIKENYLKTGRFVGFKAAGGISTLDQALQYYTLAQSVFGKDIINNKLFRIGASRLTSKLFSFLTI